MDYLQIADFAEKIGKHPNTVDNWFKALEEKRLHWVNRVSGSKVYDNLDLQIAQYIRDMRDNKWTLDGIFAVLPDQFELRPFPPDETTSVPQVVDMQVVMREMKTMAEQIAVAQVAEVKRQYAELIHKLPKPVDPLEEKQKRVTDIITQRRVITALEREALDKWSTKPKHERMKKAGLFRQEEDLSKRDQFIRDYIDQNFEHRLKQEYGVNE